MEEIFANMEVNEHSRYLWMFVVYFQSEKKIETMSNELYKVLRVIDDVC